MTPFELTMKLMAIPSVSGSEREVGDYLFAHCTDNLSYVLRHAPFATAHLKDQDIEVDFSEVTTSMDRIAVIATEPLTDNETWMRFAPGQLLAFHDGAPLCL